MSRDQSQTPRFFGAVISIGLTLCFQLIFTIYLQNFLLFTGLNELRIEALCLSAVPGMFLFSAVALVVGPVLACMLVTSAGLVLTLANRTKLALMHEPLSWRDLTETSSLAIGLHYIAPLQILILVVLVIALIIAVRKFPPRPVMMRHAGLYIAMIAILAPLALYPFLDLVSPRMSHNIERALRTRRIQYMSWDLNTNVSLNGLPFHLIQTSKAPRIPVANSRGRTEFAALARAQRPSKNRPSNIIVVECESCWHDEAHFREPFQPLRNLGMRHLRAVSPSYGGGTINASFELLTGLPARGPLGGMIYQEYAEAFSNKAITVAQQLERDGYRSIAIHPYKRNFFQRDVVLPKFGFERFISIEDMSYSGPMRWADDLLLYEAALRELSIRPRNNFFFLTTVYSHGGYKFQSDFGESDYLARLTLSLLRDSQLLSEKFANTTPTLLS